MSRTFAAIAALTFIFASTAASAQMLKTAETPKGKTFVDVKGMTLYTFDKDAGGKSMCNGPCTENWPPLAAADDAKPTADMTIVVRDDGKKMWAYKGKPLYIFKIFFFQAEDGIRDGHVTGVQTCALPISLSTPAGVESAGFANQSRGGPEK